MAWKEIIVSNKILRHISEGVYRSAGGALKELVSNAFDADAPRVVITTNYPSFDIITCYDNGTGMTLAAFERIMEGGIGDSTKRVDIDKTGLGRPVIGRLGIGMLGIAQICYEFKIISHHTESKTAFQANIKLIKMDETDPDNEKDNEIDPDDEGDREAGKFAVEEIKYDPSQAGTYVIAADIRAAFLRKFRENTGQPLPSKFPLFLDTIHKERSVKELGAYWQMVWELSLDCPIPYVEPSPIELGPFDWNNIEAPTKTQEQIRYLTETLKAYQFEVIVDGLSLRKPNVYPYPTNRRDDEKPMTGQVFSIETDVEVDDKPLKIDGYLYLQDGQAIEPTGLRGLLIRIRNVAIGSYDPTFLDYPKIEGPRFNWLSGEIYVKAGLEQALNIDRDSFNELHAHFVKVQEIVHGLLNEVFPKASKGVKQRSRLKQEKKRTRKMKALRVLLSQELKGNYKIIKTSGDSPPLYIDTKKEQLVINTQSPVWPRSKSKQELAQFVAIAFEIAMQYPETEQKEKFYKLLSELLTM